MGQNQKKEHLYALKHTYMNSDWGRLLKTLRNNIQTDEKTWQELERMHATLFGNSSADVTSLF